MKKFGRKFERILYMFPLIITIPQIFHVTHLRVSHEFYPVSGFDMSYSALRSLYTSNSLIY